MSSKEFYNLENCEITINGKKVVGFVDNEPVIEDKRAEEISDLDIPMMPVSEPKLWYHSLKDLKKENKGLYLWLKQRLSKKEFNQIDKIYIDTFRPLTITLKLKATIHSITVVTSLNV